MSISLSESIDLYLADRRSKGRSISTVRNEEVLLRQFLAVVGNIQVKNIGPEHMDKFFASRARQWKSERTYNLGRARFSAYFKWCRTRKHMPRANDPLEGTESRKVPRKPRPVVPRARFEELLDAATFPRDRAMVAIGLYLFTRISETVSLRWRDIDFDSNLISVYRHKTREQAYLPMAKELRKELLRWRLEYAAQAGEPPRPEWFVVPTYSKHLFIGNQMRTPRLIAPDRPVCTTSANRVVKKALAKVGIDEQQVGSHTLRRSGATALYEYLMHTGHDLAIRHVSTMLGHKHIAVTEVYLQRGPSEKALNDLLAGKEMFPASNPGDVVSAKFGHETAEAR